PKNAALLTFDDGFADHYETVYPILKQRGIQGCFFPPSEPIENDIVLNTHKIHTILAEREDNDTLLDHVITLLHDYQAEYDLKSPDEYYANLAEEGRYDPEEIIFIKRLLQHALPDPARSAIVDDLFDAYLSVDEAALSQEWYVTPQQLRVMVDDGMYVGSHTASHNWLDTLSREEVVSEVERSLEFLAKINAPTTDWVMCYPYGGYNE
ncbi:polysaccharide deacetylase family protein, partial [Winogradskya humida]|uniref:polysaccharide deacetylase family protein n=1 Tax=Winogradskya humida TaxID=113566 RepID=UPI0031D11044